MKRADLVYVWNSRVRVTVEVEDRVPLGSLGWDLIEHVHPLELALTDSRIKAITIESAPADEIPALECILHPDSDVEYSELDFLEQEFSNEADEDNDPLDD